MDKLKNVIAVIGGLGLAYVVLMIVERLMSAALRNGVLGL